MCSAPKIPDPVLPTPTQAARAPTRSWAADPGAASRRAPVLSTGTARTARPATTAPGTVLGR